MLLLNLFKACRPRQWTKNFFVFAGIVFALRFFEIPLLIKVIEAFVIFCFLSSAVYLINDIKDKEQDARHPTKKSRPIASGKISIPLALLLSIVLSVTGLWWAFYLDGYFAVVALAYFILMVSYTLVLKEIVILDVFSIAAGFVLRAIAGAVVIAVEVSPWLIICTVLLSLLIALGKRRHELLLLSDAAATHRKILLEYSPQLLDQLISVVTGAIVIAYALYTLWPETVAKFGTHYLVYSFPFVLYGIFRYLYLMYQKEKGGSPEEIVLTDRPLIVDILLWLGSIAVVVYWF